MNDRMPGSCWDNPIWYRGYRIWLGYSSGFSYVHDDYDGAEDAGDNRCGNAPTLEEVKAAIDEKQDE